MVTFFVLNGITILKEIYEVPISAYPILSIGTPLYVTLQMEFAV